MNAYRKIYIFVGCLIGVMILALGLSLLSLHFNPQPSKFLSLGYIKNELKDGYQVNITVGNEIYKVRSPEKLREVLAFDLWERVDEQQVSSDVLFVLDIRGRQQYTVYSDGYVHAYTGVTESQKYFRVVNETQYQIPVEQAQKILDYVLEGGGLLDDGSEPTEEERFLELLLPVVEVSVVEDLRVISQRTSTWEEYQKQCEDIDLENVEGDLPVWIAEVEYPGDDGQPMTVHAVFDARNYLPLIVE